MVINIAYVNNGSSKVAGALARKRKVIFLIQKKKVFFSNFEGIL